MAVEKIESSTPINPLEIKRPHSSGELDLFLGKDRLVIDKNKFVVGFGTANAGVVLFVSADKSLRILRDLILRTQGLRSIKPKKPGSLGTMDLPLPDFESVFIGEGGEYEVLYKDRDAVSAYVELFSTHPFTFERVEVAPEDDSEEYLRSQQNSHGGEVRNSKPLVLR